MSELPVLPFAPVPGLQALGDDEAGFCIDGSCAVPAPAAGTDEDEASAEQTPTA